MKDAAALFAQLFGLRAGNVVELTKAGRNDYRADFVHSAMKVREWCRANINEVIRLRIEILRSVRSLEDLFNLYASTEV